MAASFHGPQSPVAHESEFDRQSLKPTQQEFSLPIRLFAGPKVLGWHLVSDLILIGLWVTVTDVLLYQVGTFLGWSAFFLWSVVFFVVTKRTQSHLGTSSFAAALLVLLSAKLLWCGGWLQVGCGLYVILCYVMALSGSPPFLPEVVSFAGHVLTGAINRLSRFRLFTSRNSADAVQPIFALSFIMPLAAVWAFAVLFVLANPDIANSVARGLEAARQAFSNFLAAIDASQAFFWLVSAWLMLGLLYPTGTWLSGRSLLPESSPLQLSVPATKTRFYSALRNTLLSVILLFAFYLTFEFATLWRRNFPEEFYYAGYAHEGAFWLTAALALATGLLSVMFRGSTLSDPRLSRLKFLAATWSALNFLLALAVFNRLLIYVDFNGLTRMRVIGLVGITCVVLGFALVVIKLLKDKDFVWLLHRQLWVPIGGVILYALLPIDWLVSRYNAHRVLDNHLASVVQIIAHRSTAEGVLPLIDLVNTEDDQIREGIRALLALWARELEVAPSVQRGSSENEFNSDGTDVWTSDLGHSSPWARAPIGFSRRDSHSEERAYNFQISERLLRSRLLQIESTWAPYHASPERREKAINDFFRYAYQWY